MKIKIFYLHKDIENYENEINKFIKNKKVIDIKHSISSYGMANNYASSEGMDMSTLIMYEELEEENANNSECNKMGDFDSNINLDSDWSYPNQRALDNWRQCGFSVFDGYVALVRAKKSKRIYGVL